MESRAVKGGSKGKNLHGIWAPPSKGGYAVKEHGFDLGEVYGFPELVVLFWAPTKIIGHVVSSSETELSAVKV